MAKTKLESKVRNFMAGDVAAFNDIYALTYRNVSTSALLFLGTGMLPVFGSVAQGALGSMPLSATVTESAVTASTIGSGVDSTTTAGAESIASSAPAVAVKTVAPRLAVKAVAIGTAALVGLTGMVTVACSKPEPPQLGAPSSVVAESQYAPTPEPVTVAPKPTPAPTPEPTEEEIYYAYLRDILAPSAGTVSPGNYPATGMKEESWFANLELDGFASAAVSDIDGDGGKELIITYFHSEAKYLNAEESMQSYLRLIVYRLKDGLPVEVCDIDPFSPLERPVTDGMSFVNSTGVFSGHEIFLQEHAGKTYIVAVDRYSVDDEDTIYRFYTCGGAGIHLETEYYFGGHEGVSLSQDDTVIADCSYNAYEPPEGAIEVDTFEEMEVLLNKELEKYGAQSARTYRDTFRQGAPLDDPQPGRTNMTLIQGWGGDNPPGSYGPVDFNLYDFTNMQERMASLGDSPNT